MSTNSFNNDALDALLADSAASIGPDGTSTAITTASKFESTFVKFDDVVTKPVDNLVPPGGLNLFWYQ